MKPEDKAAIIGAAVGLAILALLLLLCGCAATPNSDLRTSRAATPSAKTSPSMRTMTSKSQPLIITPPPAPEIIILPATVKLEWSASPDLPEDHVAVYNLYFGPEPRGYLYQVSTTNLFATVGNLTVGQNYYFAVTAVDNAGFETDYSTELVYTPPLACLKITFPDNGTALEASPDLMTWTNREATLTNDAWLIRADNTKPAEFFRAINNQLSTLNSSQ